MGFFDHYRVVDLSMLIEPHWRFAPEFAFKELPKPEFTFRSTVLKDYGAHNFSHCDAPQHVDRALETIEMLPIERFCGEASLIDVADLGGNAALSREVLEARAGAVRAGDVILIRSNQALRHPTTVPEFWTRSPWITKSGAEYLLELEAKAIAFDFPQDRAIREPYLTDFEHHEPVEDWACHTVLLPKGILQIEYLAGLEKLSQERFLFFAAPLKIKGADGGPARVYALEAIAEEA